MREHEARLFGGHLSGENVARSCRIEQLEPRLLLDAVGPQVAAHWPTGLAQPIDHIEITFNEPVNPATVSADDVLVTRSTPILLGGYDTAGQARGVTLAGDLAYVADYQSGLQILDISDPAAPVRLGGYDTAGNAIVVDVPGTLAYVADYTRGLQIIDVSDPAAPVRLGGYDTPGVAYGMAMSGTTAYVADFFMGLQIIDVSDPAAPVLLGTCDTAGSAYAVTVVGNLAYVADDTAGLAIIDISDPAAPSILGTYDTAGNAYGVSVSGRLAYVSDGLAGLQVIDVSDPAAPVLLTGYDTAGTAYSTAFSNGRAYVADGGAGMQVIETHAPVAGVTLVNVTRYIFSLAETLSTGDYDVRVYPAARDFAGNPMDQDGDGTGGELPDDVYTFSFTVDATPPTAPGDLAFADDTGMSGSDNVTSDTELAFTWTASTDANGVAGYEYRLDGGEWTSTTGLSALVPATEGQHTFEVRALDGAGNASSATSLGVISDQTPPSAPTGLAQHLGLNQAYHPTIFSS